jgi:hypothetical protein
MAFGISGSKCKLHLPFVDITRLRILILYALLPNPIAFQSTRRGSTARPAIVAITRTKPNAHGAQTKQGQSFAEKVTAKRPLTQHTGHSAVSHDASRGTQDQILRIIKSDNKVYPVGRQTESIVKSPVTTHSGKHKKETKLVR